MKAKQTLLSRRCIQKMECRICLKFFTSLDHLREHMKDSNQPQQFDDLPKYCTFLSFDSRLHSAPILFHLIDYHYQDFIIQVKVIVFNVFGVVYNYVTGNATTIHGMNTKSITRPVTILGHVHLIWG